MVGQFSLHDANILHDSFVLLDGFIVGLEDVLLGSVTVLVQCEAVEVGEHDEVDDGQVVAGQEFSFVCCNLFRDVCKDFLLHRQPWGKEFSVTNRVFAKQRQVCIWSSGVFEIAETGVNFVSSEGTLWVVPAPFAEEARDSFTLVQHSSIDLQNRHLSVRQLRL